MLGTRINEQRRVSDNLVRQTAEYLANCYGHEQIRLAGKQVSNPQ